MKKRRVVYCFRIGAGAGFAQDRDGNPAECFLKLGVSLNEPEGLMTVKNGKRRGSRCWSL